METWDDAWRWGDKVWDDKTWGDKRWGTGCHRRPHSYEQLTNGQLKIRRSAV